MATQIKVKGIVSFPHVFEARTIPDTDGGPIYSCTCLIHESDPQFQQVWAVVEAEKANTFPNGFPPKGKMCLKNAFEETGEERFRGWWQLSANSGADNKPHVVDANMQPVMDRAQVYAGCEAWFALNVKGYNLTVNKGVGCYLNGLMITGGEGPFGRLDNKPSAQQMFADVAPGGAPQQPAPTAAPGAAPGNPAPAPAPAPNAAPAAPAAPKYQMTEKAGAYTRDQYIASGWTDEQLIAQGMMLPPNGVTPSFAG